MKLYIVTFFLLVITSCKTSLKEHYYKSSEEVTGGFSDFSLLLQSDGNLQLNIKVSIPSKQTESGTEWEEKSEILTGTWEMKAESISYTINEPQLATESLLIKAGIKAYKGSILTFSHKLDTAFIYGVPCKEEKK